MLVKSHKCRDAWSFTFNYLGEEFPALQISVLETRNLPVRIFSVRMSLLQSIMLPLRLMGLMIVTVALMKEPLLNVTFPNTCEEFSA